MNRQRIVIIDDDESMLETLVSFLSPKSFLISTASNGEMGYELIKKERPDLVISDIRMPLMDGYELLTKIKKIENNLPVLMMTAFDDLESTIQAMQIGAYDYLVKPISKEKFNLVVNHALETKRLSDRLAALDSTHEKIDIMNSLVGKSPVIREVMKKIGKVSSNRMTVLIEGESGTGKEVISKLIHYSGITKDEPFIAVNATSFSTTLLESELFGHVKGAFTGAVRDTKGKFELAGKGTIFFDEVSEISYDLQTKLLRVIQEKEFEKVGGEVSIPLRARIITSTNKNLAKLVQEGRFREDLFYRLNVFKIEAPPLRERREDIPIIVLHLLKKINTEFHKSVFKVQYEVIEMLQNYDWIGNVRELENTLQEAVILAQGDVIEKDYIIFRNNRNHNDINIEQMSLAEVEKDHISRILKETNWDKQKAGEILKISRPTLNQKIKTYNLNNHH